MTLVSVRRPVRWLACLLLVSMLVVLPVTPASAAALTPGNIVVYRVGDGTSTLTANGNAVFLDEFTTAGALVQSIPMPTTASGANKQLIASGTATSEGLITLSTDLRCLLVTGYASDLGGSTSLPGTTATTVNRVVGVVDVDGTVDTTTALTDFASGSNPRSAASTDCSNLWVAGGAGGVRYTTMGATTSSQLSTTLTNLRQVRIAQGQLYTSTSSGSAVRIGTIGTGTPTTSGQTITNIPGFLTSGSPYGFVFADLDAGVAGVDTLYVADDGSSGTSAGLTKYSLVGGSWTSNGTIGVAADAYRGLAGIRSGATVTLYATRKNNELVSLVDSSGYNGAFGGIPTLLATAATNTVFRGVTLTPGDDGSYPNAVALGTFSAASAPLATALPVLGLTIFSGIALSRRRRA